MVRGRSTPPRPPPGPQPGPPHGRRRHVRLWRWRSNPLRRREDLIEAWIILVVWIVIVIGGVFVGALAGHATHQALDQQRAGRHSVTAVLDEDARSSAAAVGDNTNQVRAKVHWTGPDGSRHTGHTLVDAGHHAGYRVHVWTDQHGRLTSAPASPTESALQSVLLGGSAAVLFSGVSYAAGRCVRVRLDNVRAAQWDKEWEDVEPRWRHRMG